MEASVRHVVAVVPVRLAGPAQVEPAMQLVSLWATAPGIHAIVVDDASPEPALLEPIVVACHELGFEVARTDSQSRPAAVAGPQLLQAHGSSPRPAEDAR